MSSAGSALMGIGRASGENRAIQAAQQAIESPLLEVSIDGARGILFNVIGGNDLSMHEINTAAEAITAAADPDANIIFGATISPELDGEIIITVVATGFDASYFANRQTLTNMSTHPLSVSAADDVVPTDTPVAHDYSQTSDADMASLDMNVQDVDAHSSDHAADFTKDDQNAPNIWALDADAKKDSELGSEPSDESGNTLYRPVVPDDDDELDKPSFLRRLTRRRSKDGEADTEDK